MDMKTLAMRKKRELLGSINKRKMSLRKYIDNLKQDDYNLDITQITKCVFLGSLCLKPVPQLFDSPSLLEELDMNIKTVKNSVTTNDENNGSSQTTVRDNDSSKKNCRKKSISTPKIRKKTLREKNEPKLVQTDLANVKNETIIIDLGEPPRPNVDMKPCLTLNNEEQEGPDLIKIPEEIYQQPVPFPEPNFTPVEEDCLNLELQKGNSLEEISNGIILNQEIEQKLLSQNSEPQNSPNGLSTDNNILTDIKSVNLITVPYDLEESLKREPTPELILSDSDEDAIDQLMFNIMDIKVGPHSFGKDFFDLPPSDIEEEYDEYTFQPTEINKEADPIKTDSSPTNKNEKKQNKRLPQCKICSQVFATYLQLKYHRAAHNGDKPYLCVKCYQNHASLDELIAHLRTHDGKRPYVCKKCHQGFRTTRGLEDHQQVHVLKKLGDPTKKTFRCETCGKTFYKLCDLERHTRVHTGEKPSVCNICNKGFQQAHNLNKHLLIHTQQKPYECDICHKRFGRNDVLNRHLLTHSVKKPNRCEICMKSFIRASQLAAHKKKNHSEIEVKSATPVAAS